MSLVVMAGYLTDGLEGGKAYVESGLRECGPRWQGQYGSRSDLNLCNIYAE